jgi:hypothetical protein
MVTIVALEALAVAVAAQDLLVPTAADLLVAMVDLEHQTLLLDHRLPGLAVVAVPAPLLLD